MGHLVNPAAMRMGWSSNWIDLFFVDQKYYPQYLHILFKMRLVLHFIFKDQWFEKKGGFFYSHFLLAKDYNSLLLRMYFYDGKTETFFYTLEDYVREDQNYLFQNLTHHTYHERKSDAFFSFYVFFIFFRLFHEFFIVLQWSKKLLQHGHIERIANAFFLFDKKMMRSALQLKTRPPEKESPPEEEEWEGEDWYYHDEEGNKRTRVPQRTLLINSMSACEGTHLRFFYFYLVCRNLALNSERDTPNDSFKQQEIIHQLGFIYCLLSYNSLLFSLLKPYLSFLLNHFTLSHKKSYMDFVEITFLVITNENITAPFIARYIAVKLRQGFTTRELLNPLKKEFNRLLRFNRGKAKSIAFPFEFFLRRCSNKDYFSSLFRTSLRKLSLFYHKQNYLLGLSNKTALSYDSFISLKAFLSMTLAPRKLLWLCKKHSIHYFFFAFFTYNRILIYYQYFISFLFKTAASVQYHAALEERIPLSFFPSIIPKLLDNNFENWSTWEGGSPPAYKYHLLTTFLTTFRRKMHILYSEHSHYYLAKAASAKSRALRLYRPQVSAQRRWGFRGFKIQCLGRFTRKQRSAKLTWIGQGVPLNTISANIDYGTYQTVLINSAVNVKVWFYKDDGFLEYYLKIT